jgi:hypothetical protein
MTPSTPQSPQLDAASPSMRAVRGTYFDRLGAGDGRLEDQDPNAPTAAIMGTPPPMGEFPGDRADVILVGSITGVQAFQSNNHAIIYTESTIRIEQVIDQTTQAGQVKPGGTITLTDLGGALQLPNSRVIKTVVRGGGNELQPHGRYVFFLRYMKPLDAYGCTKAWQLTGGKAAAVASDDLARVAAGRSTYHGMDEASFIGALMRVKASYDHAHPH